MAKGWHRESQRHSLARLGIKSPQRINKSFEKYWVDRLAEENQPTGNKMYMFRIWDEDFKTGQRLNLGVFPISAKDKKEAFMKALPRVSKLRRVGGLRVVVDVREVSQK